MKTINKFINLSLILSILFIILGITLLVMPEASLESISYMLGAFLLVYGIYNFIDSFRGYVLGYFIQMPIAVLSIILGIVIYLNPNILETLIPVILGIFFIVNGLFKMKLSFIFKDVSSNFVLSLITSILMVICGLLLFVNPKESAILITSVVGMSLTIYAISDLIDMFIFKKRIKDIENYFNKLLKGTR